MQLQISLHDATRAFHFVASEVPASTTSLALLAMTILGVATLAAVIVLARAGYLPGAARRPVPAPTRPPRLPQPRARSAAQRAPAQPRP